MVNRPSELALESGILALDRVGTLPAPTQESNVCAIMANAAQILANVALQTWRNAKDALVAFDMSFSQKYLGNNGIGTTYGSAIEFFKATVQPKTADLGEGGFRAEFKEGDPIANDQVHHFAGHLSAGINDQVAAHRGHKFTDLFTPADRALSNAAFKIGQDLRNDPTGLFVIGERIMKDICAPE